MKIIEVPKWVLPWGYGLTLYKLILVSNDAKDKLYVEEHEKVHVEQWTRLGFFTFLYEYFKELIKVGYINNKFEVEARHLGTIRASELRKKFEAACCGDNPPKGR